MPTALPDPIVQDQALQRNFDALAAATGRPARVTTLSSAPADGTEVYYAHSQGLWHLRYALSDDYWYFLGGAPLTAHVLTDETFTADSAYNNPATAGPEVTLPLSGDYDYSAVANMYTTSASVTQLRLGISVNDAAPAAADVADERTVASGSSPLQAIIFGRITGTTAAQTARMKYTANNATAHTRTRRINVWPVRVQA